MALASDLMGLGVSPLLAARTATGGVGPLTVSGTSLSGPSGTNNATKLGCNQFLVAVTNGLSTGGLALPVVGGDNGALLADDFVINNQCTTTIFLFASSGVSISVGASNTSFTQIGVHTTITLYPISTTQWIGCKGA